MPTHVTVTRENCWGYEEADTGKNSQAIKESSRLVLGKCTLPH